MKKFTAMLLSMVIVLSLAVGVTAEDDEKTVKGIFDCGVLRIEHTEPQCDNAMIGVYSDGRLVYAKATTYIEGCYAFELSEEDSRRDVRINYFNDSSYWVEVQKAPTMPEATQMPEATPTPEATAKPSRTPYPEVYEKAKDAINAPAVVMGVAEVALEGELSTELKIMYHGKEMVIYPKEGAEISSAPMTGASLIGKPIKYLEAGDVVHLTTNMQGRVVSVELIYRPGFADYIADSMSMTEPVLTGYDTYVLCAVINKYDGSVEVSDASGVIKNYDVHDKAFVYKVTKGKSKSQVDLEGVGPMVLPKTYIPDENYDENNKILWSGVEEIEYALLREARGTVTDVIIFEK